MAAYGWTEDFIRLKLTGAKGWVYYNWAKENEMTMFGAVWERKSAGYVKQEYNKIMERRCRT